MIDKEYVKRMEEWYNEDHSSIGDEGEELEVYGPEIILKETKLDGEPFPDFIKEAARHFGERVKTEEYSGTLIGISYTYVDYYYIIQTHNGKKYYSSSVDNIYYLQDKNSENNLEE